MFLKMNALERLKEFRYTLSLPAQSNPVDYLAKYVHRAVQQEGPKISPSQNYIYIPRAVMRRNFRDEAGNFVVNTYSYEIFEAKTASLHDIANNSKGFFVAHSFFVVYDVLDKRRKIITDEEKLLSLSDWDSLQGLQGSFQGSLFFLTSEASDYYDTKVVPRPVPRPDGTIAMELPDKIFLDMKDHIMFRTFDPHTAQNILSFRLAEQRRIKKKNINRKKSKKNR